MPESNYPSIPGVGTDWLSDRPLPKEAPQPRASHYAQTLGDIFWEGAQAGAIGAPVAGESARVLSAVPRAIGSMPPAYANELFAEQALAEAMARSSLPWTGSEVVQMSPDDFRSLAHDLSEKTLRERPVDLDLRYGIRGMDPSDDLLDWKGGPSAYKMYGVEHAIESGTPLRDIPYLAVDETGRVIGHEGRHRATALRKMGYPTMPVELISSDLPGNPYGRYEQLLSESPTPRMGTREAVQRGLTGRQDALRWPMLPPGSPKRSTTSTPAPKPGTRYLPVGAYRDRPMPALDSPPARLPLSKRLGPALKDLSTNLGYGFRGLAERPYLGVTGPALALESVLGALAGGGGAVIGGHAGRPDIQHGFTPPAFVTEGPRQPDPYTGEVPTGPHSQDEIRRATRDAAIRKQDPNALVRMELAQRIAETNQRYGEGAVPDDASLEELERMFPDIMRDWVWE